MKLLFCVDGRESNRAFKTKFHFLGTGTTAYIANLQTNPAIQITPRVQIFREKSRPDPSCLGIGTVLCKYFKFGEKWFLKCDITVIEKTFVNGKKMYLKMTLLRKSLIAKIAHVRA